MSSQQGRERQDKEDNNKQNNVSNYLFIDYLIGVLTPLDKQALFFMNIEKKL